MSKWIKKAALIFIAVGAVAAFLGYDAYQKIYGANVLDKLEDNYLYIPTNSNYQDVVNLLNNNFIKDTESFEWVAQKMKYDKATIRAGRYKINPNMSNRALISLLRSGKQTPVRVVLINERLPENIAGKVSKYIEADSLELINIFKDKSFLAEFKYNREDVMTAFIPNTYEFYWNTSAKSFFKKMVKENNRFWNEERKAKAAKLKLSQKEVYTLASIVERETNYNPEKRRVAGVYLNRLKKGMKLEADPTVVFALKNFGLRRILNKHLEFDSPYNTYMYAGLPPGPISLSSIASLDGVLNAEKHNYLFFCAKPDNSGTHAFAKTYNQHLANARKYHRYLRSIGR